jgi:hypothetical protein
MIRQFELHIYISASTALIDPLPKKPRRLQIDLATQQLGQLPFHLKEIKSGLCPGANSTNTSMSLSGPKSSRSTEPKKARRVM